MDCAANSDSARSKSRPRQGSGGAGRLGASTFFAIANTFPDHGSAVLRTGCGTASRIPDASGSGALGAQAVRHPGSARAGSSSGWRKSRLLIGHLLQPHDGAAQEFPHGGGADSQRRADFGIPQAFQPQEQAAALLLGKALHGVVKTLPCVRARAIRFRGLRLGSEVRLISGSKGSSEFWRARILRPRLCATRKIQARWF